MKSRDIELEKIYQEEAKIYDKRRFEDFLGAFYNDCHKVTIRKILSQMNSKESVLEVAPGTGRLTEVLTKKFNFVTVLDISKNMLMQLKKKIKAKNLRIYVGNSRKLPYNDNTFDSVFSFRR